MTDGIDRSKDFLQIVIDDGTGVAKAACKLVRAQDPSAEPDIITIRLNKKLSYKTQKAVLVGTLDKGHLIWSESDVTEWEESNPVEGARVCQLWKLALSEPYRDQPAIKAFFKSIGAEHGNMQALEEFIEMHLTNLCQEILQWLIQSHPASPRDYDLAKEYWTTIQWETFLMVPATWSQDAQSLMQSAATAAGFRNVAHVYESLVAVASEVYPLAKSQRIKDGEIILVIDIGRGTVELFLKILGKSTGGVAGSQLINDGGWEYVQDCPEVHQYGGISQACEKMGISIENFQLQVSNEIERRKNDFPGSMGCQVTIYAAAGWENIAGGVPNISIHFTREKMKAIFDHFISKVKEKIQEHLEVNQHEDKITRVIMVGGGSKGAWVREGLDSFFRETFGRESMPPQQLHPTCHGALLHYPQNHAQKLPEGVLYISRDETWDEDVHSDAPNGSDKIKHLTVRAGSRTTKTRRQHWVEDRLTPIMSKRTDEPPTSIRVAMEFPVLASKGGYIKFPLYHSRDPHKEHQPVFVDGVIQPDLAKWTVRFTNLLKDFDKLPQFPIRYINNRRHHIVSTIVSVEGDEGHLDVVIEILKPGDLQFDEHNQARADIKYEPLKTKRLELWDKYRSFFPAKDEAFPRGFINNQEVEESQTFATLVPTPNPTSAPGPSPPAPTPTPTPQPTPTTPNTNTARSQPRLRSRAAGKPSVSSRSAMSQTQSLRAESNASALPNPLQQDLGFFVSDAEESDNMQDSDYQDPPARSSRLRRVRKRQPTTRAAAKHDIWSVDSDEDERSSAGAMRERAQRKVSRTQVQGTSLFKRFGAQNVDEDAIAVQHPEPFFVTARSAPMSPSESPSLPPAPEAVMWPHSQEETKAALEEAARFADDPCSQIWREGRLWRR
ncbi:hypothetical protein PRZ48_007116 [Zasmidium cellare]|uniref:Uncharacterized protein n=1 Tax=Zasmidium cellare TaxID=395010 RepID=A0ABR0EKJ2_ZASCE|nr:hypothetical protein PRZ48_007116 [Zasmidium cellare]